MGSSPTSPFAYAHGKLRDMRMARMSEKTSGFEKLATRILNILAKKESKRFKKDAGKHPVADVFLVSPRKMREIKQQFLIAKTRGKKLPARKVVDVLAFSSSRPFGRRPKGRDKPFPHPDRKGIFLGEVYLNEEIVRRDPDRGLFLFIHGFLHLVGYDHVRVRDRMEMEKVEQMLLRYLHKATRD